jgi:hypothetical protein
MTYLVFALVLIQDRATVEGRVVNALTEEPLRRVRVSIEGEHRYSTTTGADGKFSFKSVEPFEYEPMAQRAGFLDADEEDAFEVGAGEHKKDVLIKMVPQGVIAGHIVDEDGDPIPDASVLLERGVQVNGQKRSFETRWDNSNTEGYFFFGGLKPGSYWVVSSHRNRFMHGRRPIEPSDDLAPSDPPQQLHLGPGGEFRNIEIRMKRVTAFRVAGKVSNPAADQPSLYLTSESEDHTYASNVNKGEFEFEGVVPGSYELTVSPARMNQDGSRIRTQMYCRMPVTVGDHDVAGITVELTPGPNIEGTIKMDGGTFAKPPKIELQVFVARLTADVKEDGTFAWNNIAPDKHMLRYEPPEGAYVKSLTFNRSPVTDHTLDLRSGGGTLEIVVSPKAATIEATVRDANNVYIGLWNDSGFVRQENTDSGDSATFTNLAPGEYRIAAYSKSASDYMDFAEFRARFDVQKITLSEGASQNIEVKLIPKSSTDAEIGKLQ